MVQNMLDIDTLSSSLPTDIGFSPCLSSSVRPQSLVTDPQKQLDSKGTVSGTAARPRKDSGYSEEPRRPIYRFSSDSGTLTFLELQRNLDKSIARKSSTLRHDRSNSRRDSSTTSIGRPKHQSSQGRLKENEKVKPAESSHRQQAILTLSDDSKHEMSRASSRTTNRNSQIPNEDSDPAQQKTILVVQTSELSDGAVSSNTTSRSASILTNEPLNEQYTRSDSSSISSIFDLEAHMSSPFYAATNIDWTDPNTRRKAYEKHDRDQRGLRRLLKKLTPRKWQTERLQFYDGDSDAGSVRRYRLDIDGAKTSIQNDLNKEMGNTLRQSKHAFTCFPLSRSTSRIRSE